MSYNSRGVKVHIIGGVNSGESGTVTNARLNAYGKMEVTLNPKNGRHFAPIRIRPSNLKVVSNPTGFKRNDKAVVLRGELAGKMVSVMGVGNTGMVRVYYENPTNPSDNDLDVVDPSNIITVSNSTRSQTRRNRRGRKGRKTRRNRKSSH
jgi:hypothetical protein